MNYGFEESKWARGSHTSMHIAKERWCPPWYMMTGTPSAKHFMRESKEKIGERCMMLTKK